MSVRVPSYAFFDLIKEVPSIGKSCGVLIRVDKDQQVANITQRGRYGDISRAKREIQRVVKKLEEKKEQDMATFYRPQSVNLCVPILRDNVLQNAEEIIFEVKQIASYSHASKSGKEIEVPGEPPRFVETRTPFFLSEPSGRVPIDFNAYWMGPQRSLEPLFASVLYSNPQTNFNDYQLITDRNNLRKLLLFLTPSLDQKPFRIDYQRSGNTLIFLRREKERDSKAEFGNVFEKHVKEGRNADSDSSFHVINAIRLGSLSLLVRAETDAVIETEAALVDSLSSLKVSDHSNEEKEVPDLLSSLEVKVIGKGKGIHKDAVHAEIKCFNIQHSSDLKQRLEIVYPQIAFGGTECLVIGKRDRNQVLELMKMSQSEVFSASGWEGNWSSSVKSLEKLINLFLEQSVSHPRGVIAYDGLSDKLELYFTEDEEESSFLLIPHSFFDM